MNLFLKNNYVIRYLKSFLLAVIKSYIFIYSICLFCRNVACETLPKEICNTSSTTSIIEDNKSQLKPMTSTIAITEMGNSDEREVIVSTALLILLCSVVISLFITHVARHFKIPWVQSCVVSTTLGILVGSILKFGFPIGQHMLDGILSFNDEVFFIALLPPIIFESGYSLAGENAEHFLQNFGTLLWFAIFATFISFISIGSLMFLCNIVGIGASFSLKECFAFGAVMSSTDPVGALTILKDLGTHPLLFSIISGESLMNDALAILLYRSMVSHPKQHSLLNWCLDFCAVLFGSMTIGVVVGLIAALIYKHMNFDVHENRFTESALLLIFPWISYLVADGCSMSGIVAILFSGMSMARYTYPNLSSVGKDTSTNIFGTLSILAESTAFILLGIAVFSSHHPHTFDWKLYFATTVSVSLSRVFSIYLTCLVVNLFRYHNKIPIAFQHIISLCGIRGAVAFALALRSRHDFGIDAGSKMLSATLFYAVLTITCMSTILPYLIDILHLNHHQWDIQYPLNSYDHLNENLNSFAPRASLIDFTNPSSQFIRDKVRIEQSTELENMAFNHTVYNKDGCSYNINQMEIPDSSTTKPSDSLNSTSPMSMTSTQIKQFLLHLDQAAMKPIFCNRDPTHNLLSTDTF